MKKKPAKKDLSKKKPTGKIPPRKKPVSKKPAEEKIHTAKCPECGFENPTDSIYCAQCANMLILKRQDVEPPLPPIS